MLMGWGNQTFTWQNLWFHNQYKNRLIIDKLLHLQIVLGQLAKGL
jgi:hypothetical protein